MKLDRDVVIRTAIRLLDQVGLEGLSLRRLAKELDVQAPALYWHFKNKQELLDQMLGAMADEGSGGFDLPAPGQAWDDWLLERGKGMRAGLLAHRDGALLAAGTRPPNDRKPAIDEMLRILRDAGFTAGDSLLNILALSNYVTGSALEEQSTGQRDDGPPDGEGFPSLTAALTEIGGLDRAFEHGLILLIDGMRARLEKTSRP